MSGYLYRDAEDVIQCPYDKVHMVRIKRFPYHLMKCRKNHPTNEYAMCHFNARHEMPKPELRYHLSICPDRKLVEEEIFHSQEKENNEGRYFKGDTSVPSYFPDWNRPESKEDWDAETPPVIKIGVDPKLIENQNQPLFKNTMGMTRMEKKAFAKRLRRRHERIAQGLPPDSEEEEEETKPQPAPVQNGLRLPRQAPQVLQQVRPAGVSKPQQQQPSVFAYSLSMAGIGRGRGVAPAISVPSVGAGDGASQAPGAYPNQGLANGMGMKQSTMNDMVNGNMVQPSTYQGKVDENVLLLQAMSRGRGCGAGSYIPQVGNPPGIPRSVQNNAETLTFHQDEHRARAKVNNLKENSGGPQQAPVPGAYSNDNAVAFVMPNVQPTLRKPTSIGLVAQIAAARKNVEVAVTAPSEDGSVDSASAEENEEDKKKKMKKLQKKLKGIEHLELKQTSGQQLNDDELNKIKKKKVPTATLR